MKVLILVEFSKFNIGPSWAIGLDHLGTKDSPFQSSNLVSGLLEDMELLLLLFFITGYTMGERMQSLFFK